jgi:Glu-tRNA(Gln) amidotransferase subunit E-like FAD-binding protein
MSYQKEIEDYVNNGTYDYKVDSFGNFTIDANNPSFNSEYISFTLNDFVYDSKKIEQLNQVTFQEFIPTVQSNTVIDINMNDIFNQPTDNDPTTNKLTITAENADEIQYIIQKLQSERDDANKKLNDIISRLEPQ